MASRLLATCLYTTGTLLITVSGPEQSALLFPAISCLITSGMLFYTTNAQVGNLFDSHRSTVISVYAGAFDSSAAVFLIIKVTQHLPDDDSSMWDRFNEGLYCWKPPDFLNIP
uniref:solute carrier family 43 member 3-like n=1 Tax=Oncorhynchus gorbuscha TaxID=8017 RepID=UPI001EAEB37F|nr:solute carrier family 43 member 3-like [Oncorhynchus gorbuscha]